MWTTLNDPIDPQGLYVLLGAQEGAFTRQEVFKRERCLFSLSGKISVEFINSKISSQISTSMWGGGGGGGVYRLDLGAVY